MEKKVALVTNATGYAGPGAVAGLLEEGMLVACSDPTFDTDARAEEFIQARPNAFPFSVTEPSLLIAQVIEKFGRIDALVSNDIIQNPFRPIDGSTPADLREVLEVGVVYPFELTQAVLPHMTEQQSGSIILITSVTARHPLPETAIYGAARAAATAYAIALGQAVGPSNIQVNVIGPHWMKSPTYFPDGWESLMPSFKAKLDSEVPLRRLGRPDELGALIGLLASQKAMPLTAQFINFTAGA
jgi:3-oxoacyl-[acyl-carrier protein] reductase